jgi:CRISPR-associated endonuclease/helicase Cas3
MKYREFFQMATGGRIPFRFQEQLRSETARHIVLKAPTGLGKTDAALVAWLHRRANEPAQTARRLVWCLPGRALTEQIARVAEDRISRVGEDIRVYRLMGGSKDNDLNLMPDVPAILVGTQDLLLSRALNRGYARNPFRWPIDFALLNCDCEWVLDEVQLLGDGLATSSQMAAFRERFGSFGPARTCWMSATFNTEWLQTVDLASFAKEIQVIAPAEQDLADETVRKRVYAEKVVEQAPPKCRTPKGTAELIAEHHRSGTISLAIANTVDRAVEIRAALAGRVAADLRLLHSRFRAADRDAHLAAALSDVPPEGRVIVATQVIEAGIDLDASLLVTDAAPWPSLVQRFGRVNRYGERPGCRVFWVDRPLRNKRAQWAAAELKPKELAEVYAPYPAPEVMEACSRLEKLKSAAPADLPETRGLPPWRHVLRRADLLDLFDTSADLGGNQLDISRFVRSGEDRDDYVGWRNWTGETPPEVRLDEGELCPVPIGEFDKKLIDRNEVWFWNATASSWEHPVSIYPGMVLLLHSSQGKYTTELGWFRDSRALVPEAEHQASPAEGMKEEPNSFLTYRQLLEDHTRAVCQEMERLLEALNGTGAEQYREDLKTAARLHDWGKAHPVMQQRLHNTETYTGAEILAKQKSSEAASHYSKRFFRHELASALAMIESGEGDLPAYLAAAHHGRVRVAVRSMPEEHLAGEDLVRGLKEGDTILPCDFGGGTKRAAFLLKLAPVALGDAQSGPSWTSRVLRLCERLGPFRLAYLEMLLRMADEKASERTALEAAR